MLNISLTAKVLGWNKLSTEMNILPVLIATGRVHYSPQVGYHNTYYDVAVYHISHYYRGARGVIVIVEEVPVV